MDWWCNTKKHKQVCNILVSLPLLQPPLIISFRPPSQLKQAVIVWPESFVVKRSSKIIAPISLHLSGVHFKRLVSPLNSRWAGGSAAAYYPAQKMNPAFREHGGVWEVTDWPAVFWGSALESKHIDTKHLQLYSLSFSFSLALPHPPPINYSPRAIWAQIVKHRLH